MKVQTKAWLAIAAVLTATSPTVADQAGKTVLLAARQTCKQMTTCEDAVILWCNGYTRADGDNDGIPCENVCRSQTEVEAIRAALGC